MIARLAFAGAVLALLAIGVRPTWPGRLSSNQTILVTAGADAGTARRLADSLGGAAVVADPADLPAGAGPLHVVGWGLDTEQWPAADQHPVIIHPAPVPPGFARASWTGEALAGEALEVEGRVAGLPAGTRVALTDPAGHTDSMQTAGDGRFALRAWPRAPGRQVYLLEAGASERPFVRETLAVNVVTPPRRRVLLLHASPSFEIGALRDWLASRGDVVAIRTAVSRDRVRSEFVNRDRIALSPITDRLLEQFDVAQIDGRTLIALSKGEHAALRRAVQDHGLGLLIVPDTMMLGRRAGIPDYEFFLGFTLHRIGDLEERLVRPVWTGARGPTMVAVPADPYTLQDRFGTEGIIDDGTGGVLAQVTPRGAGRVGVSLVTGSSRWALHGQRETFGDYWSRLLAALTAGAPADRVFVESAGPWLVNQPIAIRAEGSPDRSAVVVTSPSGMRDTVFLAMDRLTPDAWRGLYWPREPGWHQVGTAGTAVLVQGASAWRSHQASLLRDASARYAVTQLPNPTTGAVKPNRVPIPRGWFYGLFVLCATTLWSTRRPTGPRTPTSALS